MLFVKIKKIKYNNVVKIFTLLFILCICCLGNDNDSLKTLRINNHPKASGLDILLKFPSEWKVTEGERPHVLKRISNGNKTILVLVNILPKEVSIEDAKEMYSIEMLKEIMPKGSTFQSGKETILEGHPAWIFMYSTVLERLGVKIIDCVVSCIVVYKKYSINLQGHYILTPEEMQNIAKNPSYVERYKTAIKEMMEVFNSLVINNRYK